MILQFLFPLVTAIVDIQVVESSSAWVPEWINGAEPSLHPHFPTDSRDSVKAEINLSMLSHQNGVIGSIASA